MLSTWALAVAKAEQAINDTVKRAVLMKGIIRKGGYRVRNRPKPTGMGRNADVASVAVEDDVHHLESKSRSPMVT